VQQAHQRGTAARHDHLAVDLADATYPADESAKASGVHERHFAEIDEETLGRADGGECLPELGDGECVKLANGPTHNVTADLAQSDVEHTGSPRGGDAVMHPGH
jgi:hypothetical protein